MKFARAAAIAVLVLGAGADAVAQQTSEYLTWARFVHATPGREADFVALVKETSGVTLDAMMEDGTVISWGIAVPFSRRDPTWTHFIWISYAEWADMDTVMTALGEAEGRRSEKEQADIMRRAQEVVRHEETRDVVMRQVAFPARTPRQTPTGAPAYFKLAFYGGKPEHAGAAVDLYREVAKPTYDELLQDGEILDFGLAMQELTSDAEWKYVSWQILPNLAALDVIRGAREEADAARSPEEQARIDRIMNVYLDLDAYRSELCRIVVFGGQTGDG